VALMNLLRERERKIKPREEEEEKSKICLCNLFFLGFFHLIVTQEEGKLINFFHYVSLGCLFCASVIIRE
jgi:hypothetical protein